MVIAISILGGGEHLLWWVGLLVFLFFSFSFCLVLFGLGGCRFEYVFEQPDTLPTLCGSLRLPCCGP